jgi:hypothetical protein
MLVSLNVLQLVFDIYTSSVVPSALYKNSKNIPFLFFTQHALRYPSLN